MRALLVSAGSLLAVLSALAVSTVAAEPVANIDEQATHQQTAIIEVPQTAKMNAFCLDRQGQILAACGEGPGEVRVMNGEGEHVTSWKIDVKPEAINVAPDGTVLVAGQGRLFRLSPEGKVLQQADSPHAAALRENTEKLREQAKANLQRSTGNLAAQVQAYKSMLAQLEAKQEKEELNAQEKQVLKILPDYIKRYEDRLAAQGEQREPEISQEAIDRRVAAITQQKLRVSSISADDEHVYIAAPSITGYTFEVWKMGSDFAGGEVIVSDLRGCCGQMDVQACSSGVYVAENARHRVACFKPDGEVLTAWGERDRTGAGGFTSCCNPMNVCFNAAGDVFTAESTTGRIKRFGPDGEFKEFIGDVKLVPGCKNVSIAVSGDNERVYMLDITRNHIVLMTRKAAPPAAGE
ncbi:MAG: hypothetical protein KY475_16565 [Planctomycetes bacterium]|nr:hypothetical protein [Planctomycetota bacterium]